MLILLSPSKGQDFSPDPMEEFTRPKLQQQSKVLAAALRQFNPAQIAQLMSVSEAIAELNYERFQAFKTPFKLGVAKQAALAFKGDVYGGLDANSFNAQNWDYAQDHLRILSGLYGYLRPMDLILPYRLEMKTKLANPVGENLYQFWDAQITALMNKELKKSDWVVNLASNEYFKAVKPKLLKTPILHVDFKDTKDGNTRSISFYAKRARGLMARAMINHQVTDVDQIKDLVVEGYKYREHLSTDKQWIFERPQPPPKNQ